MPEAKTDQRAAPPRFEELLARAEALIPVLRERAARAEELRRLPDETIEDLHRTGLFRILQPKRVGGSELPFRAIVELVATIGRGDGSTAWVLANLAAHHWLLGMWPPKAQDEIWGESPDNLIDFPARPCPPRRRRLSAVGPLAVFERGRRRRLEPDRRDRAGPGGRHRRAADLRIAGARLHDHRHLACDRAWRHRQQGCYGR